MLDWSGYIDQGKQLSILHSLLIENFSKLPPQKQTEMAQLTSILDRISQIKESTENNYQRHLSEQNFASMDKLNGHHKSSLSSLQMPNQPPAERGIMRGVLTPNSLQKNIVSFHGCFCGFSMKNFFWYLTRSFRQSKIILRSSRISFNLKLSKAFYCTFFEDSFFWTSWVFFENNPREFLSRFSQDFFSFSNFFMFFLRKKS